MDNKPMRGFTECPKCSKGELIIPLMKTGRVERCPLCAAVY